jgi:dTDP-4-dehydrorhamnose reductase
MKFLIFGSAGMAGHMISIYLQEQGHEITGFDQTPVNHCDSITGDVRNLDLVKKTIEKGNYDVIVNCIGILNQFAEKNKELAVFVNTYFPHFLVSITHDLASQIIHMSTDCVFSGKKGEYVEGDFKDGESFYDRTKALGEINDKKNITFRNSIIGPDINVNGIGLFNWFMKQNNQVNGYTKVMWTGLTSLQLAKAMEEASIVKTYGLFNLVNEEKISKYFLLKLMNKNFRKNNLIIHPFDSVESNKTLKRTNFDFNYKIPSYEQMINEMFEWIIQHKNLYPHYNI